MNPQAAIGLLKDTFSQWQEDKASRLAAALAYYTAFSVAPLLLIAIVIAGLVFGDEAAQGQVFGQLEGLVGPEGAGVLETAVRNSQQQGASAISAVVGIAALVWSASNVFAQLQDALNAIWEVAPDPRAGILATVRRRFFSMTMVLGVGFLLLVSLVLSSALAALGGLFAALPGSAVLWEGVNFVVSFAVITLLFAAIYKVLPDVKIAWGDVWIGATMTAALFVIGKLLIGLYLGNASVGSTYGAAGSLLVVLVWVYYSAQLLFFGAEFTQVYARRYGSRMVPTEDAVPMTEEARAQQGMPSRAAVEHAARTGEIPRDGAARAGATRSPAPEGRAGRKEKQRHGPAGDGRPDGARATAPVAPAGKKILWAALAAGVTGATQAAAVRTAAGVWRTVMREEPPRKGR
jgi:membrane protein